MASNKNRSHLDMVKTWALKYDIEELEILLNNGFDNLTSISFIDEKDLDGMKISKLGSRKKILAGVSELNIKIGKLRNNGGSLADIHSITNYINADIQPETNTKPANPTGDELIEYVEVRKSVLPDVPQMCSILNYYNKNFPEITGDEIEMTEQQFTKLFYEQDERHLIIVTALTKALSTHPVGTILGYCNLKKYGDKTALIDVAEFSMFFHPDFKSKGIGMALSMVAAKLLFVKGFTKAIHRIAASNTASIKLTEKLGFVKVATMPGLWSIRGKSEDVVIYQKDLVKDRETDGQRVDAIIAAIHQKVV